MTVSDQLVQDAVEALGIELVSSLRDGGQKIVKLVRRGDELGVLASVIETAFIESHAGAGILRTRSRPNWSISRCRSGCSSGFQPSSSSRSLSHRAATTRS